jgi:hypothetical protein
MPFALSWQFLNLKINALFSFVLVLVVSLVTDVFIIDNVVYGYKGCMPWKPKMAILGLL